MTSDDLDAVALDEPALDEPAGATGDLSDGPTPLTTAPRRTCSRGAGGPGGLRGGAGPPPVPPARLRDPVLGTGPTWARRRWRRPPSSPPARRRRRSRRPPWPPPLAAAGPRARPPALGLEVSGHPGAGQGLGGVGARGAHGRCAGVDHGGSDMTIEELATATGLAVGDGSSSNPRPGVRDGVVGGVPTYDDRCPGIARAAGGIRPIRRRSPPSPVAQACSRARGRLYRTDRPALLKQRNPEARQRAHDNVAELSAPRSATALRPPAQTPYATNWGG